MKMKKKIYGYFIMQAIEFYLLAFFASTASCVFINLLTDSEYILSFVGIFVIMNLIIAISIKSSIEKECGNFCCSRKDITRINLIGDLCIGVIEGAILGAMLVFAHTFPRINNSLRLLDLEDTMGKIGVLELTAFAFLLVMATQAVVTFDFMRNNGILKMFYGGNGFGEGGKAKSVLAIVIYVVLTAALGFTVAVFVDLEKQSERSWILAALFVIMVVFYVLTIRKARHKEFDVENV